MPQVFWATCPHCQTRFPCEKKIWDNDLKMLCPSCEKYFKRSESPHIETVWPVNIQNMKSEE